MNSEDHYHQILDMEDAKQKAMSAVIRYSSVNPGDDSIDTDLLASVPDTLRKWAKEIEDIPTEEGAEGFYETGILPTDDNRTLTISRTVQRHLGGSADYSPLEVSPEMTKREFEFATHDIANSIECILRDWKEDETFGQREERNKAPAIDDEDYIQF